MRSRGQSGLDLVLALIIVLTVMSSFSGVIDSFTNLQKQSSIRQQVSQGSVLVSTLISSGGLVYREPLNYPTLGVPVVDAVNSRARFNGSVSPFPIKSFEHPQGLDCVAAADWANYFSQVSVSAADGGLSQDVVLSSPFYTPVNFNNAHSFVFDGCDSPIQVRGLP